VPSGVVAQQGVDLSEVLYGAPVAHLPSGTAVTEVRSMGGQVLVETPDGLRGWVAADRLEAPAPEEAGETEG